MKRLFARKNLGITMLVMLSLLVQIVIPIVPHFAYAKDGIQPDEQDEQVDEAETCGGVEEKVVADTESDDVESEGVEVEKTEELEDMAEQDEESENTDVQSDETEQEGVVEKIEEKVESSAGLAAASKDLGNIFEFDYLKLGDEEIEDGQFIDVGDGTKVSIQFKWSTQGLGAKAGDWASIMLPDVFKEANVSNQQIIVDGVTVGTYSIVGRELKLEFNEEIEKDDVKNGYIGLGLEFNIEKFKENIEQEIKFNDSKKTTLKVIAKPKDGVSRIDKEGHPDNNHDAKEITWTIDVLNPGEEKITNAVVKDNIPKGLTLQEDSFVVKELTVGYEGNKVEGSEITVSPEITGDGFEIPFENMDPYKGYRIEYTTTIEDYSKKSFTNDAHLIYGKKDLDAKATVGGLTRSDSIEKDGKHAGKDDTGNDLIEWTILVNKSGGNIDNAIISDELPEELIFVKGSMKVEKFIDNWTWADPQPEGPFNEFPVNLGKVESNEFYRITFKTTVDWSEVNGGNYQQNNKLTNETILYDGETKIDEAEKDVWIWRSDILRKEGNSNVNYNDKTLTWTVHVNEARHPLDNVVLTDILPKGLDISKEDIVITDEDGNPFTPVNIEITPDPQEKDKSTKIEIDLGDIGTEYVKVEYKTTITDFKIDTFENRASLGGGGIGEEGGTINPVPVKPPANSFEKSFSDIDYNAKIMSWQLIVNPQREAISELKIVDTFPNKGLILLPGTLEVRVGGNLITEGYTLTPNIEDGIKGYQKGFTLEFENKVLPLNELMVITYKTSYDPQYIDEDNNKLDPHTRAEGQNRIYKNRAKFIGKTINDHDFGPEKDAQKEVREDSWNSGKKEGKLVHLKGDKLVNGWVSGAERKIAWQLYTNYQEQNLGTKVSVTDTLAYEGEIDEDSVKVSVYEVDKEGKTTITDEVLDPDKYDLEVDGKEFTLTFNEGVNERYVIEFTTTVPDISQEKYTNDATVQVGKDEYPYTGTVNYKNYKKFLEKKSLVEGNSVYTGEEIEWKVTVNESLSTIKKAKITDTISKGLVYVNDSLEVYKLVGNKEELLEKGTDYTFKKSKNADEETVLELEFKEGKDIDTIIVLRYKTVVTETKGQVNNKVELEGTGIETITKESEKLNASQFSWAGGEFDPKKGALRVTKVDAEDNKVIDNNEAEFTLEYELNGKRVQFGENFTTQNGVLEIGGLPLRTYYLKEVEAPNGYVLSEEEITIGVTKAYNNNEENIVEVEFENTKEKIEVTGTKEWVGGPETKPEIELQLKRDGEVIDTVTLDGSEGWTYTWNSLDKTDIDGVEYDYTVDEVEVEGYNTEITGNGTEGFTVTNTRKTYAIGDYTWIDKNKDGIQGEDEEVLPGVKVELYYENSKPVLDKDGKPMITYTDENGLYIFDELEAGNYKIKFTLTEEQAEIYEFTKLTSEGDKAKTDSNANPVAGDNYGWTTTIELGDNSVTHDYENKEKNPYKATEGIDPTWDAGVILRERIDITGSKTWDDADNQDGKRPESITIKLLADGKEIDSKKVAAEDNWEWTFADLHKTEPGSAEDIVYTIVEETVEDYSSEVDGYNVTNSHTPGKTSVQVTKAWNDFDNRSGERPESITVKLLADGEDTGETLTLTADNNWTDTFTELDEYKAGRKIEYTVEEVEVDGYNTEITGDATGGFVITNTRKTYAIGDYTWIDSNKDGIQDEDEEVLSGVIVELYDEEGKLISETTTDENGLYIFDELEAGKYKVKFTLTEEQKRFYEFTKLNSGKDTTVDSDADPLTGWTIEIALDDSNVYLTKEYTDQEFKATEGIDPTWDAGVVLRERIEVTGTKKWIGGPKNKPTIELQLYRNGEAYGEPVELKDGETEYTWTDLYKTDENREDYKYHVDEVKVPEGYKKSVSEDGLTIMNTYVEPEKPKDSVKPEEPKSPGLPKTGATTNIVVILMGVALIAIGVGLKKKRA